MNAKIFINLTKFNWCLHASDWQKLCGFQNREISLNMWKVTFMKLIYETDSCFMKFMKLGEDNTTHRQFVSQNSFKKSTELL